MKVILNTSFFFAPQLSEKVRAILRERWVSACKSCGCGEPVCLRMEPEEGIERLAVQTPFTDADSASRFRREVLEPIADEMTRRLGMDAFTCFSTQMEVVDL